MEELRRVLADHAPKEDVVRALLASYLLVPATSTSEGAQFVTQDGNVIAYTRPGAVAHAPLVNAPALLQALTNGNGLTLDPASPWETRLERADLEARPAAEATSGRPDIEFIGPPEVDGAALVQRLCESLLAGRSEVPRAWLCRVSIQGAQTVLALCIAGAFSRPVLTDYMARGMHIELIFVSAADEVRLSAVCQPFLR